MKLTTRQEQILNLIRDYIQQTGSPTRADIASEFGFKSANAAEEHLKALAKKGVIEIVILCIERDSIDCRHPKRNPWSVEWPQAVLS